MGKLQDFLCLRDRDTFTINPREDSELYFGRQELEKQLKDRIQNDLLLRGVPKIIMHGPYGSGKTHTLYHVRHYVQSQLDWDEKLEVIILSMGPLKAKTSYQHLHRKLMDALGRDSVQRLAEAAIRRYVGPDLEEELRDYFDDSATANAVRFLCLGGKVSLAAWKWLCGDKLNSTEQEMLNIAHNLTGTDELVRVLVSIGKLYTDVANTRVIFLIDEAETLREITDPNSIEEFRWAFRELSDDKNRYLGFVLAYQVAGGAEEALLWLEEPAILTRLGGESGLIGIPYLARVEDARQFIQDLLDNLVDRESAHKAIEERGLSCTSDTFPFSEEALSLIEQYVTEDPLKALPRIIINKMNECAVTAFRGGALSVDEDIASQTLWR
jgi:hypothetical protein